MKRFAGVLALIAGALFLVAAVGKVPELGALALMVANNLSLPTWFAPHFAAGVVLWEFVLAGWLISAPGTRGPALAGAVTLVGFAAVKGYWIYTAVTKTCHCLGAVADTSGVAEYFLAARAALGIALLIVPCVPRSTAPTTTNSSSP